MRATVVLTVVCAIVQLAASAVAAPPTRPNVLFIAVDDLRPMLGCYGDPSVQSPHIDRLAASGVRFERAYCQFALCNPSRSSLLSGRRPETLGVFTLATFLRDGNPDVTTLPEHFRAHGYETRSYGKIFHVTNGNHDDERSWSVPPWPPRKAARPAGPEPAAPVDETSDHSNDDPSAAPDVDDDELADGRTAAKAIEALEDLRDKPFFLAVGFHKPHLPFIAPQRYWDRYDPAGFSLPSNTTLPENAPAFASNDSAELRRYKGIPAQGPPVTDAESLRLIHGYHACVSYTDAQVGRLLDAVERLGLAESTVVVLWGDHGYHLADQGTWTKRTAWEIATRVPLVIRVPGRAAGHERVDAVVELLDIYPTLVDLCGLQPPPKLEGRSLVPLLEDPAAEWPNLARSMIVKQMPKAGGRVEGRAVRTPRYRWIEWSGRALAEPVQELYDHDVDPLETRNIAGSGAGARVIGELRDRLVELTASAAPQAEVAAAAETVPLVTFATRPLDGRFYAEGSGVGDFNRDGIPDVVAGPFWFAGPTFVERHEFTPAKPFDPLGYSDTFFSWTHDIDADGWDDILVYGFPGKEAAWFANPRGEDGHWRRHVVLSQVDNESPTWADIDGDHRPEIVCSAGGFFGYAPINREDPTKLWTFHRISPEVAGGCFTHGLGVGDVDGDGRVDLLEKSGWWKQPDSLADDPLWRKEPFEFSGPGGAQMHVRDVDGDGLADVITSLAAHGWGLGWWRQVKTADHGRSFEYRRIMGDSPAESPYRTAFSQVHAIDVADIDGDGLDDIVTGKRFWAHGPKGDPEPSAPAVVYWFRCTRPAPGEVEFVPYPIHADSGVGVQVTAADATGDGLPDVVVANKKGIFVHAQSRDRVPLEEWEDAQPRKRMPLADGLAPAAAARAMSVPPGFSVKLLAAEPDVCQPIAMCFDDRGRLWVAEAYSYPRRVDAKDARDRILIFEDTDGDHAFDSRKVFKEGLNLVSGLEVGFGGVWVGAAPELLFIPDADGDDMPDAEPRVLLDGWGWQDTHETLNAFTWGPDGWLYGCHGVFTHSAVAAPGAPDDDRTKLNAGIWRYHPTRHRFEVFAEGTSNPWGIDFNQFGHAFETACVIPHLYHVIQGGRYQRQAGQHFNPWTFDDIKTVARHRHWVGGQWTPEDRDRSDAIGGGHAHAGACFYLGGAWPEKHRGKLFMNNIHGARLNEDRVTPQGSGYVGDGEPDFLFANDAWSQFISLQVGPDGQMVILDWYDRNQCHHGDDAGHDRSNGRIFKVVYERTMPRPGKVQLASESDAALVDLLAHDNDWFVRHARRLLQERAAGGRLEAGTRRLLETKLAAAATTERRLRVIWALHAIGPLEERIIAGLLDDPEPVVRSWAIQLAAEVGPVPEALLGRFASLAATDPAPVVRLALCSAAQRLPLAARWPLCRALVGHPEDADDHNLPLMNWYAIEPLVTVDPSRAMQLAAASRIPLVARFIVRRAACEEGCYEPLVQGLASADSSTRKWMLEEIVSALAARGRMAAPQSWDRGYEMLRLDGDEAVQRLAGIAAVRFGDPRVVPKLRAVLADRAADPGRRLEALEALVSSRDEGTPPVLRGLLDDPSFQKPAIVALASFADAETPPAIVRSYGQLADDSRQAAIAALVSRPAWTLALLDAIAAGTVPRGDLSAFTVGRLAESADAKVLSRLNEVWGTIRVTPDDRKAELAKWRAALGPEAMQAADPSNGREVFTRTCGSCHALHGAGGRIGPDLTGSNRGDLDYLLTNLLDPSAVVGRDYQTTTVLTTDGRSIAGIVVSETPTSVTLQTPTERLTIPHVDIDQRVLSPQSLMPENQLAQLAPEAARDLIAYMRHPEQVPLSVDGSAIEKK